MKKIIGVLSLLILIFVGSAFTAKVNAQLESQTVSISPPSLKFNLNPGDAREGKLSIINDSEADLNFIVRIYDFIVTDTNGTPQILAPGTLPNNSYSASSWIAPAPDGFTVKAHQRFNLNYFIKVPSNAAPGGHYAAIVYQPVTPSSQQGSGALIQIQIATLAYITVNGPVSEYAKVTKFSAPKFQEYGPVEISTQIKNFGDVHITPIGTITVKDIFGKVVASLPLKERNIFPGNVALDYTSLIGSKFMIGKFTASLLASYDINNNLPLTAKTSFFVFPWRISLVIIAVIIIIILAILLLKKNKQKKETHPEHEKEVKSDNTIRTQP